ncbi:MAG: AtpZ/AtpI family protein [Bryobacterales bacterium]|nr:AtpZ/AtpI family protein [Bryobacteraceae bacterium]MDW8354400.1 AtpZ/AtpI family protein [Bryobacterales bacterium]
MKREKSWWVMIGEYTSLAFLLPAATVAGYLIGYLLDRALGTSFLKPMFLVLGIIAGFLQLLRQVQKNSENDGHR